MLSSEITYRVNSIRDDKVTINGYSYIVTDSTVQGGIELPILMKDIPINLESVGKYFHTKRAYLTSDYTQELHSGAFGFRVDSLHETTEEEFNSREQTFVTFNARINKSADRTIEYRGPMRIPTFSTRVAITNEVDESFYILVVGFHNKAKALNSLARVCYVDITGSISAPRKAGMKCAIVLKSYILRKEVEK